MPSKQLTTTCPMDCPDTCALEVAVTDERVTAIGGGHEHPNTAGFICTKVARFGRRLEHPDRLLHPMRRTGPKGEAQFERISWEDAVEEITRRFREISDRWGGEAILPFHYGGSNGLLTDGFLDRLYFARLGASRLDKTVCAAPATALAVAMYGKMPGVAFEDFAAARCIVVWGANPKTSNIHLVPYLKEAKRRGAFIAVVDPVRNFSPQEADLHLPVRPGTDLPLALGLIRLWRERENLDYEFLEQHATGADVLLEAADAWPLDRVARETGVDEEKIERLAGVYADTDPAVIRVGWGLERNRNGGHAIAAVLAIPALLGKFGVRGGGYTLSNNGGVRFDADTVLETPPWNTRLINMTELGAVLGSDLDPPIKALFVYNCNPAATIPDQNAVLRGLQRDDLFTVVLEQVMTDTARFADILLPATTFLEHHDLRVSYGAYVVAGVRPVIPANGEARSNHQVFTALGRAMGWEDEAFTWPDEEAMRRSAGRLRSNDRAVDLRRVEQGEADAYRSEVGAPVQFNTVFPATSDGRIHLAPAVLGDVAYRYLRVGSDRYPLALISPATNRLISSTLGEFNFSELYVELSPEDAAARHVVDGATVRVFNDLGEVVCRARVRDRIRAGVVLMPKGAWRKSSLNGQTATALCPAHVNDVAGGACFNDALVEIEGV